MWWACAYYTVTIVRLPQLYMIMGQYSYMYTYMYSHEPDGATVWVLYVLGGILLPNSSKWFVLLCNTNKCWLTLGLMIDFLQVICGCSPHMKRLWSYTGEPLSDDMMFSAVKNWDFILLGFLSRKMTYTIFQLSIPIMLIHLPGFSSYISLWISCQKNRC